MGFVHRVRILILTLLLHACVILCLPGCGGGSSGAVALNASTGGPAQQETRNSPGSATCGVSTRSLKVFVRQRCSACPILRRLLLEEPDELPAQEFIVKCEMWLRVLAEEGARHHAA